MLATGRLTCAYKLCTEMMRLGSSKALEFYGSNLQNNTSSLMRCVRPVEGRKFIQPDQAGAEALIVAHETTPGRFRKLFDLGIKPHSYMALQLFPDKFRGTEPANKYKGIDPEALSKLPECKDLLKKIKNSANEYFLGKKTIHSFNYDEGIQTFRITTLEESEGAIVLTFADAKAFKGIWGDTFKEILDWQATTVERCKRDGVLRNLFGFPRSFERIWNDSKGRQALAFVPQSTVAVITHMAYTELWYRIRKEKLPWKLLNNKHDSLLLDVPDVKEHEEMGIQYCRQHMGRELVSSRGEHYAMKVGISVGHNWDKYDEKKNPQGLVELN